MIQIVYLKRGVHMARPDYLSTKETAYKIGCSTSYVLKLIKLGELTEYKVGNRHFVPVRAVEDYIRRNTKEGYHNARYI